MRPFREISFHPPTQARALGKHFARVTVGQQLAGSQSQAQPPLLLPVFTSTAVRAVETAKLALAEMQVRKGPAAALVSISHVLFRWECWLKEMA